MSRQHFDDEATNDFRQSGKKRKTWKDQRHQKGRNKETKRDIYEHESEEQDNGRNLRTRW